MSTTLIIILLVVVVLIGLITFTHFRMKNAKPVENSKKIVVLGNKNFKLALKKEILLVDFWAPWCGPCKMQTPILEQVATTIGDRAAICKVNVDEAQALAQRFAVRSIPTLVIFKDGQSVQQLVGLQRADALVKALEEALGQ